MKRARKAAAEASLPPPFSPAYAAAGEDAKMRFKLQSLAQDYQELIKDTAAKRRRVQIAKQRALTLTAEVKFLRRRYKFLVKNTPPVPYKVKTHSQKTHNAPKHKKGKSLAAYNAIHRSQELGLQLSKRDGSYRKKEAALPSTSAAPLDLNQVSLPDGEADSQIGWGTLTMPMESSSQCLPEGEIPGTDVKISACRDARGGSSRAGKRKVSWQDQVALKV